MSFFSRLLGASAFSREQKSSRAGAFVAMHALGQPRWTSRDYAALTRTGYERNAVVYRCVRLIAEGVASVQWRLYDGDVELENHPLLDLIKRPNPAQTQADFIEAIVSNLLLFGNAYLESAQIDGQVREIYNLRPDRMSVCPDARGWPAAYEYRYLGDCIRYLVTGSGVEPILHVKLAHPLDDHYGLPPLAAAQIALDIHNAAGFWNKALLDNSARPSGALVYGAGAQFTDAQFERLKSELEESFSGPGNAGRPLLLDGGLDWKTLSLSPKDMDFIEAKAAAAREIALCFGVPSLLLGLPGDNTRANYSEANKAFWRSAVIPMTTRLQKAFESWLSPAWPGLRIDYDMDRLEVLAGERQAEWTRIGAASFLTDDEKRAAVGYGPKPAAASNEGVTPGGTAAPDAFDFRGVEESQKFDFLSLECRYSDDQPRDDRGRWVATGEIGVFDGDARDIKPTQLAQNDADTPDSVDPQGSRTVDLHDEESRGGHTIERHIAKSDEYLIRRLEENKISVRMGDLEVSYWQPGIGSFTSLEAAEKIINSTISDNLLIIEKLKNGEILSTSISKFFNTPTGYEAYSKNYRSKTGIRTTYGVRVVIKRNPSAPNGFSIVTAFPIGPDT